MAFVTLSHHTFFYVTAGQQVKPPLLLLHGFLGSHQDFESILPALSQHFYCIVPDLPGHGQTLTEAGGYDFCEIAQSLCTFLDALGITQTHLLGYSMGGRLALYMTCHFPHRFTRTVLESASPGLQTADARKQRQAKDEAIARALETTPFPDFLTRWYNNSLFSSLKRHPKAYAAMLARRHNNNSPKELAAALRGLSTGRQPSLWNLLAHINTPLLLITGALDTKFVTINREMLAASQSLKPTRTKQAQTVLNIVENCGHNIQVEAPDRYERLVSSFLAQ